MAELFAHMSHDSVEVLELNLPQQLDFNEFDRIIENLSRVIGSRPAAKWVIDLSQVHYTGSAVLGLLVNLRQRIRETGGSLVLCGLSTKLMDILRACSLDRLFKTAASRKAALKAVG